MSKRGYRQFLLVSGPTCMMTWLEDDKRLGVGTRLTLKGDDTVWTVDKSYGEVRSDPPAKEWKVGGLV